MLGVLILCGIRHFEIIRSKVKESKSRCIKCAIRNKSMAIQSLNLVDVLAHKT